ncbi:MAG: heavy metal translocating P-type ATPase [Dehalococcoidia bacterium]
MTNTHEHNHHGHDERESTEAAAHVDSAAGQASHAGHSEHGDQSSHGAHASSGNHSGHAGHGDHAKMFRDRFWVSLVLAIPVIIYSPMVQMFLGYTPPAFPGADLVGPVLGTVIFAYGGSPFLTGGWSEARTRKPGMMLLIAMAITVAFVASMATTFGYFDLEFWWELAALIVIMLLGHWLEMRAIGQARGALSALAELLPDEAERVTDHGVETVKISDLAVGDVVLVRSGGRVPADGTIIEGAAEVDESMVTGESRPVPRSDGDKVIAASIATDSSIRVRVDAVGEDTALAGIQRMVEDAQKSSSRAQALADRAAALLFYAAIASALLTVGVWTALGQPDSAVTRTVTVLIIACPHALGLAIPLVISISTSMSARNGILVKDRLALERMRTVDTVVFDKTGTLTKGEHRVTGLSAGGDEERVLALSAAVEWDSEHPLARAVVAAARERQVDVPRATEFRSMTGRGVEAQIDGVPVAVGGPALLNERGLSAPDRFNDDIDKWKARGAAVMYVVEGDQVIGVLSLEDEVRPASRSAVDQLHALGVRVVMITGDARQVADAVAADIGIDEVFAEVLPEDKDSAVGELQSRGHIVAMVGDGVNDAPALARADVGIAIGAGTDVAMETAGIVLASDDPRGVVSIRKLSQASYRKMLQNLGWAAGYNVLAIPLAAGVLAWAGFVPPPAVGAVLMSLSTVVVALNAQLLRGVDLRPEAA